MSFTLTNGLLGFKRNTVLDFTGSDHSGLFAQNLLTKPDDWYYRHNEITYSYNDHGHRCKNVKDLNFNNYILFVGCSHSEGVGNKLEDTHPYLVSKELGMDYYNLSLGGSSGETMRHNLTVWLTKFPAPKYIVWQWSFANRFLVQAGNVYVTVGSWNQDKELTKLLVQNAYSKIYSTRDSLIAEYLNQLQNSIPIIQFAYPQYSVPKNSSAIIMEEYIDFARDDMHNGRLTHQKAAQVLVEKIINT